MPKERPPVIEQLTGMLMPLGPVDARAMFGGWGLYIDGIMFALVAGNDPYFRADDENRDDYESLGFSCFKPWDDKPATMPYYPLPQDLYDDPDKMLAWAERALAAARRAKAKKPAKKRKSAKA